MVRIQLETGYLDVKEDTSFPLNFGVGDIRDLSKRTGANSKTIVLSGTKNNHDLLNHYYDVNIEAGTFNVNALTRCSVIQNGIPVLEDAYIQLLSVNKRQLTHSHEEYIEYEALVKDTQSDFFTKLDNSELADLDFTDLNHVITAANVVASFTNTVTDGYVYPINHTGDIWYPIKEMRPAIYAKQYWDRIHATAGFSYTWTSLSDAYFDKLIIPFNGDALQLDWSDYDVDATATQDYTFTQSAGANTSTAWDILDNWTEVLDNQGLFTPLSGEYSVPFTITQGESINYKLDIDYDLKLVNNSGGTVYLVDMDILTASTKRYYYKVNFRVYKNGSYLIGATVPPAIMTQFSRDEGSLPNGETSLGNQSISINLPCTNLLTSDILDVRMQIVVTDNATIAPRWKLTNSTGGTDTAVDLKVDFTSVALNIGVQSTVLASGATLDMNLVIPRSIKQKDFIKSICTMYNLMAEQSANDPNTIVYSHRDDYYDNGTEKDWSQKIAKNLDHQLQFLPELSAKKITLSYKQDQDEPNKIYLDTTREVYSQVDYTFDNEYVKGNDLKELIFTPSPMGKNFVNAITPMVNGAAPKTGVRILIHNGTATCDPYNIYDYGTPATTSSSGQIGLTTYPLCHHWDDPYTPTFSIEFGTNDFYYYDNYIITNNNLYNLYWRRTLNQINEGKMLTAYFDLTESDIASLKLSDKIWINNSWWHINKVIDYDCNSNSLTKVELMSVDSEIDFVPFKTRKPKFPRPQLIANATNQIKVKKFELNNVNYSQGGVVIRGYGNVVPEGLKGFIQGDEKELLEDGVLFDTINNSSTFDDNFANADLTLDANRNHDTAGYDLQISTDGGLNAQSNMQMTPTGANWLFGTKGVLVSTDGTFIKGATVHSYAGRNTAYTLTDTNYLVDCTSGPFTINLPTAVGISGRHYVIKNSGIGVITVDGNGTETIDGATTITLNQYDSITVVSDGANWIII
jgi:hypothetical protein